MTRTLAERFWEKVEKRDGCWGWKASTKRDGYGQIWAGPGSTAMLQAQRVAWELHYGPIPDGLCVLHRCDNPPCCNPAHLFLGTREDNNADMVRKGRAWSPQSEANRAKTHCPRGHAYTPENTVLDPKGGRKCRTCSYERAAARRARMRPQINARQNELRRLRIEAEWGPGGKPARHHFRERTACSRGHIYTDESTLIYNGARYCRICHRERQMARYNARKEAHQPPSSPS